MLRATLKSLLGRKLRLLMSTFAIVLGVAFVGGSLIFSDTLGRSFTALFASTVGDVVVRPADADSRAGRLDGDHPRVASSTTSSRVPGAARVDGNVTAFGVYVVDKDNKVVGGQGPPAIGGNYSDAPAGHGCQGLALIEGRPPRGPDEVVFDAKTAERSGYFIGEQVHIVTSSRPGPARRPKLVGIVGLPRRRLAQRRDVRGVRHPDGAGPVPRGRGRLHRHLGDRRRRRLARSRAARRGRPNGCPTASRRVTGDAAADEAATDLLEAISFLRTFLLIFAGISLVVGAFLIVNTFSILVAQRSRELALLRALGASKRQVTRSVLFEAFVVGVVGLDARARPRRAAGDGHPGAVRELRARPHRSGADLRARGPCWPATSSASSSRWRPPGCRPAGRPGSRPCRRCATTSRCPRPRSTAGCCSGWWASWSGPPRWAPGCSPTSRAAAGSLGLGILVVLLGVDGGEPGDQPAVPRARPRRRTARVFGTVGNLAGQNSLRNPRRTTATASALMIGLALACTMAILGDSAKASVDKAVEENFVGDYVVSSVFGGRSRRPSPTRWRRSTGSSGWSGSAGRRPSATATSSASPASTRPTPTFLGIRMVQGTLADFADGTVLVDEGWAEDEGLAVGDTLHAGEDPTGEHELRVAGIFAENPVDLLPDRHHAGRRWSSRATRPRTTR